MQSLIVDINLSREKYLLIYQTYIRQVKAFARNGQSIRFPVTVLQPFVTPCGVQGTFLLVYDDNNKFRRVERL